MGKSLVIKVLDKQRRAYKISLLASRFSLLIFTFYLLLLASNLSAQVIIKEKVEINPQTINPEYQISALDPCPGISRPQYYQSVYSCSGFPIEPYQQLYPFQSGTFLIFNPTTMYEAEIISGTDYAYFERVEYIDSTGNFFPYETFGTLLSGLTGAELSGTGDFIGYEGAGTFERENSSVYRVRFDNYSLPEASVTIRIKNLNDNSYTDWHTLIVNPDLRFVNQQYEADTLLHYYSKDVTPKFMNANSPCSHPGYGGCPPDNVTFNIEIIEGQQFGSIKNSETSETATSFTGLSYNNLNTTFIYYANGEQPDSTSTVKIRHSSSDADIVPMEFSFTIKKNNIPPPSEGGSIYVKMDKKVVIPGDTVNVQLLWVDEVNDTVEFSQIQRFKVDLAEGSEYGTILDAATGDTSDTFTEITNEFKVIVNPQIDQQQAKIVLVAEADLMIFTRPVSINNGTKTAEQLQKNSVDKVDEEGGTNTDFIIIGNHLVGVGEITITKTPFIIEIVPAVVSAGDTAQIIPMKLNSDGTTTPFDSHQTFELGMLDGCALGYLSAETDSNNYFYEVKQPFYFIADTSADSGSVIIRVGVIEMNQQNRSLTNNNTNIEKDTPSEFCFLNSYQTNLYVDKSVVLESVCSKLPKCTENNAGKKPDFEIMDFPDGTDGNYKCNNVSGITYMLWSEDEKKLFLPIQIENCYDENANVVQFGIKDDLITLRAIVTACEDVIIGQDYRILYNTAELKTKVPQNLSALTRLYLDLDIFLDYFTKERPNAPAYYPIELAWEHEFQHKKNYVDEIFNVVNKDFDYLDYSRVDVSCGKYGNMNDVVDEMKYNFEKRFSYFEKESIKYQFKVWGKKDGTPEEIENYRKNENETHNAIAPRVIGEYKNQIQVLMKQLLN